MLSAQPRDNAELDEFMLREFFIDASPAQPLTGNPDREIRSPVTPPAAPATAACGG